MTDILQLIRDRLRERAITVTLQSGLTASLADVTVHLAPGHGSRITGEQFYAETDDWNAATGAEPLLLSRPSGDDVTATRAYGAAARLGAHAAGTQLRLEPRVSLNAMMAEAASVAGKHLWPWVWTISHRQLTGTTHGELYPTGIPGVKGVEFAYQIVAGLRYEVPVLFTPPELTDPAIYPNGHFVVDLGDYIDSSFIYVAAQVIPTITSVTTGDDAIDDLIALGAASRIVETEEYAATGPDDSARRRGVPSSARLRAGEVTWGRFEADREALRATLLARQEELRRQTSGVRKRPGTQAWR